MKSAKRWVNKLNQKTAWYPYWCPIFSSVINLAWNTWVVLNKEDIDKIISICREKKIRFDVWWGYIKSCMQEVYNYIAKSNPEVSYSIFTKDSPNLKFYYEKGYMIWCGISVNNKFIADKRDNAKIDTVDYKDLAWTSFKHVTNLIKGFGWKYEWKDYVNDSYFWNSDNLYEVNLKEMIEDVLQNTCFMFYIK